MRSLKRMLVIGLLSANILIQGQASSISNLKWSGDGRYLSWNVDQQIRIIDTQTNEIVQILPQSEPITAVAWSSDGRIAIGTYDATVRVYEVLADEPELILTGDEPIVFSLAWSSDNRYLVGVMTQIDRPAPMYLWDATDGDLLATRENGQPELLAFSPDGSQIAGWLAYGGGVVDMPSLDFKTRYDSEYDEYFSNVSTFSWSPDGKIIAAGTNAGFVKFWDHEQSGLKPLYLFTVGEFIRSVTYTPDGKSVLVATSEGTTQLWDVASQTLVATELLEPNSSAVWSPYGGRLAYLTGDATRIDSLEVMVKVPLASIERMEAIAAGCYPESASTFTTDTLSDVVAQVEALPEGTIPAGCAADLIAVVEAIIAQ